jgi:small-conductance mechanosensitive channel
MAKKELNLHERTSRITFAVKLIAVLVLWFLLKKFPETIKLYGITERFVEALIFFMSAWMLISFGRISMIYFYLKKNKHPLDYKDNFVIGINQIATMLTLVFLILSVFLLLDIALGEFFTSISIFAMAIVLISKDYISNLINGMILMFSDDISLGDYVKIGNNKGKIIDITLSKIHMVSDDEELILLNNTMVYQGEVVNFTKRLQARIIVDFDIDLNHLKDFELLEKRLKDVLKDYAQHVKKDTVMLKVVKINKDMVSLKFQFVQARKNMEMEKKIRKALNRAIIDYLTHKEEKSEAITH